MYLKYLITQAVQGSNLTKVAANVSTLAQVAKANNVPLVGDWRYAARLMAKKTRATPEGQAHYDKVLGFSTPEQRATIDQLRKQSLTPKGRLENWKATIGDASEANLALEAATPRIHRNKQREFGIVKNTGAPELGVIGVRGRVAMPIHGETGNLGSNELGPLLHVERTLHTHPDILTDRRIRQAMESASPFRKGELGVGFPSGPLDFPGVAKSPEYLRREKFLQQKMDAGEHDHAIEFFNLKSNPQYDLPVAKTPDQAIDTYKKMRIGPNTQGGGDMAMLNSPFMATHTVVTPHTNQETVFKGSQGQLRRMYFQKQNPGQPIGT
jgi:hypothetical protein